MLIFSYGNEKMGESVKREKSYRQPASKKGALLAEISGEDI